MKLNLFSPLPPTRSEVARQSATLLPLLAREAEMMVWSSDSRWDREMEAHATVRHYDIAHPPWREIGAADVTFYQIGNDPRYHHAIWQISQRHPGIVILHDLKLQHLFSGLVHYGLGLSRDQYVDLVERHHGPEGRILAGAHVRGLLGLDEIAEQCPLIAAATENALAVVVHSEASQSLISDETPVRYLPLAIGAPSLPQNKPLRPASDAEVYRLGMFGFLGPNRRLPALLRALSDFPQRERFRLDIYGTIEEEEKIRQLVARFGLTHLVTLHGFVSEEQLHEALQRTDLVVNMRYPSMGEASASQLHLWHYALPSLVTRTAWYATLPENTVAFVRPEHEAEDIRTHLAGFLADPEKYRKLGREGQRHVIENHSVEAYATSLLEMAARVPEFRALWLAQNLGRRAATDMTAWCDSSMIDAFVPRVAEAIRTLVVRTPLPGMATTSTGAAKDG